MADTLDPQWTVYFIVVAVFVLASAVTGFRRDCLNRARRHVGLKPIDSESYQPKPSRSGAAVNDDGSAVTVPTFFTTGL